MVYMLSVSCLEYFIARKVRSVFEVYRSVFHGCVYNEKRKLIPDFSNPAEAARAWADQYEAAQRAIAEKSQAEAEAGVLMGRTWGTVVVFTTITVCMRR